LAASTVYYQASNICQFGQAPNSKQKIFLKWLVARHLIVLPDQKEVLKNISVPKRCVTQTIVDPKYWETIELAA
jgi:hypothetical protein